MPQSALVAIECDPAKDAENRRHRGIPLPFGALVPERQIGEVEDRRRDYGEARYRAFGMIDGVWFACVYTMRGGVTRIISVPRVRDKAVQRWLGTNWSR